MGTAQISLQNFVNFASIPTVAGSGFGTGFRPWKPVIGPTGVVRSRTVGDNYKPGRNHRSKRGDHHQRRVKSSTVDIDGLVEFLYEDLRHVFDEQGIDPTVYEEEVRFRDPITKYDGIRGYLLNIAMLRGLFKPEIILHWVKKSGPYEITTRWTAVMEFILLPWKPELVLTGTSIMKINPETGKFCSHVDLWDSVQNNDYFSLEGLWDIFKQFRFYETPELESPKYQILKRTANYEVRKYEPFMVVETTSGVKLSGSAGIFNRVPRSRWRDNDCKQADTIRLKKIEGGIAAVLKFSGNPTENMVQNKAKELENALLNDGLKPINNHTSALLARYNNSARTWSFVIRNEVLIWLQEFSI